MENTRRILFVDDELPNVASAIDFLNAAGYDTHYVSNASKALDALHSKPSDYCVVVAKRMLPEVDGIALLDLIKRTPDLKNIPVIISTSCEDEASYLSALEKGAYDLVYSPIEEKFLLYVIGSAISARHAGSLY